ncbi:unnamed protein product [Mytilus coruscus]|uniref:DDE-1 domain-containing protein n=1 Tax=Mytilus coruscus TaxID=42192 RepID=A0A6J8CNY0_MYTCO|nr:unnamed protein product [Mytilus coruscus]
MAKMKASVLFNVPRSTLRGTLNMKDITAPPTKPPILNIIQENILLSYILRMEERDFGLTVIDIRKLAYQMTNKLGKVKQNQNEIWCLPLHTTHWLQPPNRSIFEPMKTSYSKQCQKFMRDNPSRQVTKYDFCRLFNTSFQSSVNMVNIFRGFRSTEIYPFNQRVTQVEAYGLSQTSLLDTKSPQSEDKPEHENIDPSKSTVETPQSTQNELAETQTNTIAFVDDVQEVPDRPAYPMIDTIRNQQEILMTVNTEPYTNSAQENFDEILVILEVKKNQPKKKILKGLV